MVPTNQGHNLAVSNDLFRKCCLYWYNNTLKANPALFKHSTTTTIKTTAQIMHKSDNNDNNNKDASKTQYFAANAWLPKLV